MASSLASVTTAEAGSITLGVATGPNVFVAAQLVQKSRVVKAMHASIQFSADPQTESVLARQSLGVSKVNHILRVHGDRLAADTTTLDTFDQIGKDSLDRLFPWIKRPWSYSGVA